MSLPRCFASRRRGVLLLWTAAVFFGARPARAQQVYIKELWVNETNVNAGSTCSGPTSHNQIICPRVAVTNTNPPQNPCEGNISNDPEIQYAVESTAQQCMQLAAGYATVPAFLPPGSRLQNICNSQVALCSKVGWANDQSGNTTFGIDSISFEVFKFAQGTNPLDPGSAPPLRTFFIDDPGIILAGTTSDAPGASTAQDPACIYWDGFINIQGEFGKSNGQYGFRGTISTNQTGPNGNITISSVRAYPGAATINDTSASKGVPSGNGAGALNSCDFGPRGAGNPAPGNIVNQSPIVVDVVDIHVIRTSPTVVGNITSVAAQPYNLSYRLSKDAFMTLLIKDPLQPIGGGTDFQTIRNLVPGQPRVGEGIPNGTLQNGDSWNARADNGDVVLPGTYLARFNAVVSDQFGSDPTLPIFRQISVDPLQITDLQVQPLTDQSTSLAVLSFVLTEPATAFLEIYPPGTQFAPVVGVPPCAPSPKINPLNSINDVCQNLNPNGIGNTQNGDNAQGRLKDFVPQTTAGTTAPLLRRIFEQKVARQPVIMFWDGRDQLGNAMADGDYVFALSAALNSQNGNIAGDGTNAVFSDNAKSGFISISRGNVTISQIGPSSTVIGSSPPVAGLDPFTFSYTLSRDATVTMKIFHSTNGVQGSEVRTIVNNESRPGAFLNRERWTFPIDNTGQVVASGTYMVQLQAFDPIQPSKVSTTTALFPINLFRVTDVSNTPLLTGATDVISLTYQLSQPMNVAWNIYPPGTVISNPGIQWPPCSVLTANVSTCAGPPFQVYQGATGPGAAASPIITISGMRPGRLKVTEFWDGRTPSGTFVADGNYVYTLVAQSTTTPQYFASDQVVGVLTVARGSVVFPVFNVTPTLPTLFNSSQTVALEPYEISYSVTRQSSVTIQVLNTNVPPQVVRTIIQGQVRDANIINREFWDARNDSSTFVTAGFYNVQATAVDIASQQSPLSSGSTAQQLISVNPMRIFDVAISPLRGAFNTALIAYQVSETMRVSIKIYKPGTTFTISPASPNFLGDPIPPESQSLIKRIVGVRPARTEITDVWDGTDLKLSLVPDGNYVFRIFASTDVAAVDQATGNAISTGALATDIIIAEIPVSRSGSLDPKAAFAQNSFVYPNPLTGPSGTFQIYSPLQANVELRIYNIAGQLILNKSFGEQAADTYVNFVWGKTNQAGRPVAHGVYFMLVREEPTIGDKTPLQTVKKILLP